MFQLVISLAAMVLCGVDVIIDYNNHNITKWTAVLAFLSGVNFSFILYWLDKLFI